MQNASFKMTLFLVAVVAGVTAKHPRPSHHTNQGTLLPFQSGCTRDQDCHGYFACRTFWAFPPLGNYPVDPNTGVPECRDGEACPRPVRRCAPRYWENRTPLRYEITNDYNLIPRKEGCFTDRGNFWYQENFCCQNISPSTDEEKCFCRPYGLPSPAASQCYIDVPKTCQASKGRDACCNGGVKSEPNDKTTGSRCLVGFVNEVVGVDIEQVKCCDGSFRYQLPIDDLITIPIYTCLEANRVHNVPMCTGTEGACRA